MKTIPPEIARQKIRRYCAYQERSHLEVRNKLYEYGLRSFEVGDIITDLIAEGYLSEERFAKVFAGGKFRMKKWGRVKIVNALELKGVSRNCISIALTEIDDDSYQRTLRNLLETKLDSLDDDNIFVRRNQLSAYAIRKGYEPDLVWKTIQELIPK